MDRTVKTVRGNTGFGMQRGFSLVELMVALLLGSLIVIASTQLFITNQRTFQLQQGLTDIQEQGRFALDFVARDLRRTGLRQPDFVTGPDVGIELDALTVNGQSFPASSEGGGDNAANDRLTFSFHGNAGTQDCEGSTLAAAAAPARVVNTYWVNDQAELMCRGSIDAGTNGIAIVSGVDSFQVLYGVDTDEDRVPFASRYVRADQLTAADPVVTVRVGLLVRATQGNLPELAEPVDFIVLDKLVEAGSAPLDVAAVRRLFITTVRARNYTWESI
ncbi:PilW family protein [Alcanivorax sp. JB21]|uniref:PilW family protein n=1 Tax=Alcanivorax limicola TaxID=2874102 RepID=UPI001CBAAFAD|nr:PilW family protein [Alcanivorax limicola]MBZ2190523.1 PilW family protein [Alcanivorax limicola]